MNCKKIGVDIFLFLKKSDAFAVKQSNNNIDLTTVKKKMISKLWNTNQNYYHQAIPCIDILEYDVIWFRHF